MNAKGKILIIDDNEDVLFALNLLLDPYVEKIKVTTQPTRIEHFMTTFQPDVILLDMNFRRDAISGQEGFDCLEQILKLDPHAGGSEVHHFQTALQHFVVGDVVELRGCRVLLRVGGVDAVHTGTFQHDIRLNLDAAQTGTGIGSEERIACTGGHDDYFACFHTFDGTPFIVEFTDGFHTYGRCCSGVSEVDL